MNRTVQSCYECKKIHKVYSYWVNGQYCKRCLNEIQKQTEVKLSEYMDLKFNN